MSTLEPMNVVGPRVRLARLGHRPRLTQADLAARLELRGIRIDRAGIAKIEGGFRQVSDRELLALADALGVSGAWLLEGDLPSPKGKSLANSTLSDSRSSSVTESKSVGSSP